MLTSIGAFSWVPLTTTVIMNGPLGERYQGPKATSFSKLFQQVLHISSSTEQLNPKD